MAGYLLSNKKLRGELSKAKDAESAAKLLGKHLQRDGRQIAKQVKEFVESEDVQRNIKKAKDFASKKMSEAKTELKELVGAGGKSASKAIKKGVKGLRSKGKEAKKKINASMRGLS